VTRRSCVSNAANSRVIADTSSAGGQYSCIYFTPLLSSIVLSQQRVMETVVVRDQRQAKVTFTVRPKPTPAKQQRRNPL